MPLRLSRQGDRPPEEWRGGGRPPVLLSGSAPDLPDSRGHGVRGELGVGYPGAEGPANSARPSPGPSGGISASAGLPA